jgi:hypothetical protein
MRHPQWTKGEAMPGSARFQCFATLLNCSDRANAHEIRHAIDKALACDPLVRCGQRLECAYMASELADRLGRRR